MNELKKSPKNDMRDSALNGADHGVEELEKHIENGDHVVSDIGVCESGDKTDGGGGRVDETMSEFPALSSTKDCLENKGLFFLLFCLFQL